MSEKTPDRLSWGHYSNYAFSLAAETESDTHYYLIFKNMLTKEFITHAYVKDDVANKSELIDCKKSGFKTLSEAKRWGDVLQESHAKRPAVKTAIGMIFELRYCGGSRRKPLILKSLKDDSLRDFKKKVLDYDKAYVKLYKTKGFDAIAYEENHPLNKWRKDFFPTGKGSFTGDILLGMENKTWADGLVIELANIVVETDENGLSYGLPKNLAHALKCMGHGVVSGAVDSDGQGWAFSCDKSDLIKLNATWGIKGNIKRWSLGFGYDRKDWATSAINK